MSVVYLAWTDPETHRRQVRVFTAGEPMGIGGLRRQLRRAGIPSQWGVAASRAVAMRPRPGQPWTPDPRVWAGMIGAATGPRPVGEPGGPLQASRPATETPTPASDPGRATGASGEQRQSANRALPRS